MNVTFIENKKLASDQLILQANEKNELIEFIIEDIESRITAIECVMNGKKYIQSIDSFSRFISAAKKVFGYTENNEFILKYRLYQLEERLPKYFIRISNTEIINRYAIANLELTSTGIILIHLKNGIRTSSSRRYIKKIKEALL